MPRPLLILVVAAVFGLLAAAGLVACGTIDSPPATGGTTTSTSTAPTSSTTTAPKPDSSSTTLPAGSISHPTGPADVILRVTTGGGFVPIEYNLTLLPEFTLYGDGRIVMTGPTTMQYPGNALPNLLTSIVPEKVVQAMLTAAKAAGLFQNGVDYGQPGVADVPTTTITIAADGATYTSSIYALGMEDGGNLTPQQQKARAAVDDFRGKLGSPTLFGGQEPEWDQYDFTALKVFSRIVDSTATTDPNDVRPNHLPWPLADLATAGSETPNVQGTRELVVLGGDLATLKPLLKEATQITVWESNGRQYNVWMRPLLPDEVPID